jgi:hypothetical protein
VGAGMVGRRGNAAVEFGLMAPLLLALLAFSFDFGAVYSERNRLGMAAQAGADAAAWALAAEDLSAAGVPASAEAAARESVRLALGGSLAGISVSVTWAGPPSQEEQDLPGYALAVDVPRVENVEQVLDTTHEHTFSWQVPTFRQRTDWVAHRFPLSWSDNTNPLYYVTAWLRSVHWYSDRFDNPLNGTPSGPAFGWGGALYFGYWQSWQGHPWIMGLQTQIFTRQTYPALGWATYSGIDWSPTMVYRYGTTYDVMIADRRWEVSGEATERGTSDPGGRILRFLYARIRPRERVVFRSEPERRLVQTRPVRVEVSRVFRASSVLTRPVLDGRRVTGGATSVAVSARSVSP